MELQSDSGRIVLTYYAKSANLIAGGKGRGVVCNDEAIQGGGAAASKSNKSLGQDLSPDGSFIIDGQRLYNLASHNKYAAHSIAIDVKGKGFQFYTFTFGYIEERRYNNTYSDLINGSIPFLAVI